MSAGVTIKVTRSVDRAQLLDKPLRTFFTKVMLTAHADVAQPGRAPIRDGFLRSSLAPGGGVTMVDPASPPMFAQVGTDKSYAGPLDQPQTRSPHYVAGPSAGKPTEGWLSTTPAKIEAKIAALRADLASDITSAWKDT